MKKVKITRLEVASFVTSLNSQEEQTVNGGATTIVAGRQVVPDQPTNGCTAPTVTCPPSIGTTVCGWTIAYCGPTGTV